MTPMVQGIHNGMPCNLTDLHVVDAIDCGYTFPDQARRVTLVIITPVSKERSRREIEGGGERRRRKAMTPTLV